VYIQLEVTGRIRHSLHQSQTCYDLRK